MYLKKLRLRNIKCFEDVTLEFPHRDGDYSGWVVLLGQNGAGKSTIVRAIAELVIELHESSWIRDEDWVGHQAPSGRIEVIFQETRFDDPSLRGGGAERYPTVGAAKQLTLKSTVERLKHEFDPRTLQIRKANSPGWLACGYGPFRRLDDRPLAFPVRPGQAPFLTLLSDAAGIAEPFSWLRQIYAKSLDTKLANHAALAREFPVLLEVINSLLPGGVRIKEVSTEKIQFETLGGAEVGALQLSDGYRSFLALAVDLLMRVYLATDRFSRYVNRHAEENFPQVLAEGIVLIDEADAHLHPSWQRELGDRLRRVFPKIQFIVTTHSPFIAQEATDGGLFVLRSSGKGTVEVEQFEESVRGWTATQILTSPAFGLHSTRSVETEQLIRRNSELVSKSRVERLTKAEKRELKQIREALESQLSAPGETYDQMNRQQEIQQYVAESLRRLNNGQS